MDTFPMETGILQMSTIKVHIYIGTGTGTGIGTGTGEGLEAIGKKKGVH